MTHQFESKNCFDKSIWLAYHSGLLDESVQSDMEQHLIDCNACMDVYLNVVEEHVSSEDSLLSDDFTDKLMHKIEQEISWQNAKKLDIVKPSMKAQRVSSSKATLMISYCAAASIAMFFLVGGYFNGLADKVIQGAEYIPSSAITELRTDQTRGLIQTGWTQKVLEEKRPLLETLKFGK